MFLIFTISILILGAVNLLLLKFSCNKTVNKSQTTKKPAIIKPHFTSELDSETLAPTGS